MTAALRLCAAAMLCLLLSVVTAPFAAAHNGVGAAFKGPAGPYTVYAYDGYPLPDKQLEYRLVLLETATGEPAAGVTPVVTGRLLHGAGASVRARVTVMANVVLYDLANPYPDDWSVTVALSGRLGRGATHFAMHGQAAYVPPAVHTTSGGSSSALPLALGAAGAAGAAAGVVIFLRRRRRVGFSGLNGNR